jgi:hypothetical protein
MTSSLRPTSGPGEAIIIGKRERDFRAEQEALQRSWQGSEGMKKPKREKPERFDRIRLARECAKLDPKFEQAMAEEGISRELAKWPEY